MNLPQHIGVVGGGRMGAGIAHAFAVAGATVTVVETDERAVAAARERLAKSVAAAESRGALPVAGGGALGGARRTRPGLAAPVVDPR